MARPPAVPPRGLWMAPPGFGVDRVARVVVLLGLRGPVWRLQVFLAGACGGAGVRIASTAQDRSVRVWDVARRRCVALVDGHTAVVRGLTVVADDGGGRPHHRRGRRGIRGGDPAGPRLLSG